VAIRDLIEQVDKEIEMYQRRIDILERIKSQLEDVNHNNEVEDLLKHSGSGE